MTDGKFRERRSAYTEEDREDGAGRTAKPTFDEPAEAPPASRTQPTTEAPPSAETAERSAEPRAAEADLDPLAGVELPPASFIEIVQYFAIQAIQFLGEMPLNDAGERRVMPREAKHFIDLLGILQEKSRGNLSPEESRYLEDFLADLRLRYLRVGS